MRLIGYYLGRSVGIVDEQFQTRPGWIWGVLGGANRPSWFWAEQVKTEPWGNTSVPTPKQEAACAPAPSS
jgi:hypothetical protein